MCSGWEDGVQRQFRATLTGLHQLRTSEMVFQGTYAIKCHWTKEPVRGDGGTPGLCTNRDLAKYSDGPTKTWLLYSCKEIIVQFVKVVLDLVWMWMSFLLILKTLKLFPHTWFSKGNRKMLTLGIQRIKNLYFSIKMYISTVVTFYSP